MNKALSTIVEDDSEFHAARLRGTQNNPLPVRQPRREIGAEHVRVTKVIANYR